MYFTILILVVSWVVLSIVYSRRKFLRENTVAHMTSTPSKDQKQQYNISSIDDLKKFRYIGDKLADDVVFRIHKHPKTLKDLFAYVEQISQKEPLHCNNQHGVVRSDGASDGGSGGGGDDEECDETEFILACKKYVQMVNETPSWLEWDKVIVGKRMFRQYALPAGSLGCLVALIESYSFSVGAKVLMKTGRLTGSPDQVRKRLYETQQLHNDFILSSDLEHDGLPGTNAHRTIQRIRLLHAWVRKFCLNKTKYANVVCDWNEKDDGYPACQEDMIHTIIQDCMVCLEAMERFGASVTKFEKECWWHTWRYVAYMIGVDECLIPETYDQQKALYKMICHNSQLVDDNCRLLTKITLDSMHLHPNFLFLPKTWLGQILRYGLGGENPQKSRICDELGLDQIGTGVWFLIQLIKFVNKLWYSGVVRHIIPLNYLQENINTFLLQSILSISMNGKRSNFRFKTA